jgi:Ca-activated chloride channel homolog
MINIMWGESMPWWFIPLFAAAISILVWNIRRTYQAVSQLAFPAWRSVLMSRFSTTRMVIKTFLMTVGLLSLFLTLLHPQWGKVEESVKQQGRDLFIALDISRSMLATDLKPNRLQQAKAKIKRLVRMLNSERVGLLLFSGSAVLQCPLTADISAFDLFLDAVDAQTISSGSTAIDQVLEKTIEQFQRMPTKKNKLLVIFTDGEDFSRNLSELKKKAQAIGLRIFTIGIGTPQGAPVPKFDAAGNQQGYEQDEKGAVVISRLNEGILRTLAQDSSGTYFTAQPTDQELKDLTNIVSSYEKEQWQDRKMTKYIEQYPYFLAVSLTCFALEWLL